MSTTSRTNAEIKIHDPDPLDVRIGLGRGGKHEWVELHVPGGTVTWFTTDCDPKVLLNAIIHQAGRVLHRLDAERYGVETDGEVIDSGLPPLVCHVTTSDGQSWGVDQ